MTIEQYLQPFLKEQLTSTLEDYNINVVNDITYGNLEYDNDIIFQIKTGTSQLSAVRDITEITTPVQVNFKCFTNELQNILSILDEWIISTNTTIYNTDDEKYKIELLLTHPSIILNQIESFDNGSKSVSYCVFTMTSYATDYDLLAYDKYLVIDGTRVKITGHTQTSEVVNYTYTPTPTIDELGKENYNGKAIGITINTVKTQEFGSFIDTNKFSLGNKVVTYEKYPYGTTPNSNGTNATYRQTCIVTQIAETEVNSIPTLMITLKGITIYG